MRKKFVSLLALSALLCSFAACGNSNGNDVDQGNVSFTDTSLLTRESEGLLSGQHNVEIEDYGTIALTLDADIAPVSVTNFIVLAENGFYDGLTFHRILNGYMMQGGCPEGNGTGNSGRNIQGEFAANGIENSLSHTRGVISMARANDYDSASCQFFIMQGDYTGWDGNYAAFGWVTSGMEVVDAICEGTPVTDGNGTVSAEYQPVIKEVRVIE